MIPVLNDRNDVGTTADMTIRLRETLPTGWFPTSPPLPGASVTPVLDGLLAAIGSAWSFCFGLLSTTVLQTRVATATGPFLDMISTDFFASALPRKPNELDDAFRSRIDANLVRNRGTRADVVSAVETVTSVLPFVCEPERAADCGCYGGAAGNVVPGLLGYGVFGLRYGSLNLPFQYLLNVATLADFAPGIICTRQSAATFLDQSGAMRLAAPFVLRPDFEAGVCSGALLEQRGFNLITDSRFWSEFAQPSNQTGQSATWRLDHSTVGILSADPVMSVTSPGGTRVAGPSVDVAVADASIVASAWVLVSADSNLSGVELVLTDLSSPADPVYVAANVAQVGEWQRLAVSLSLQPASGKNLRVGLALSSATSKPATVSSQCWQVELGSSPTSYIPTNGLFGIREEDGVVSIPRSIPSPSFGVSDVQEAVAAATPVATIAWTSVAQGYLT